MGADGRRCFRVRWLLRMAEFIAEECECFFGESCNQSVKMRDGDL